MRTTIILDDELGASLREKAKQEGKSFSAFLADAGRRALEADQETVDEPFHLITFRGDGTVDGVDQDRTNEILAAEDRRFYGEASP